MSRVLPVIVFGLGGVGRAFLRQIIDCRKLHAEEYNLELRLVAVFDSNGGYHSIPNGISDQVIQHIHDLKQKGGKLHELPASPEGTVLSKAESQLGSEFLLDSIRSLNKLCLSSHLRAPVLVDCSATEETLTSLLEGIDSFGNSVAAANKKPFTASYADWLRLTRGETATGLSRRLGAVRHESTVGAGLPMIATVTRLLASNDKIETINGAFSGTLGFVFSGLQDGKKFSEIVREAHAAGYTEPDPRDDLGGVDVARKALILARMQGLKLEMSDVQVEPLYPASMATLSVPDFLQRLPELDQDMHTRVATATAQDKVLRYAANIQNGALKVGVVAVDRSSPLGRLQGTDNLLEIRSRYYARLPLVIQGPGAGVDCTAAGVLSDVVELAFTTAC